MTLYNITIYRLGTQNGPFNYGRGCILGIVNFYERDNYGPKWYDKPMVIGPIVNSIDKVVKFNKPFEFSWSTGCVRMSTIKMPDWNKILKEEPQAMATVNLWVAKSPEKYVDLTILTDISVLSVESPHAQAMFHRTKINDISISYRGSLPQ